MQLPIKVELNFDEEFINLLKELKPKRGGIYSKVYKELLNDIIAAYHHTRKGMKAKVIGGDDNNKLKEENQQLKKYLKFCLDALIKFESDICNSDKFRECKDCVFRTNSNSTRCKLKHYDKIIELLGEEYSDSDSAAVEEGEK